MTRVGSRPNSVANSRYLLIGKTPIYIRVMGAGKDWRKRGEILAKSHRLHQFDIADWLVEGIELNGATASYDVAESIFPQYHRQTFVSWVTVARHFPASMRIESEFLTFAHYQVVQGAEKLGGSEEAEKLQLARQAVWLRQADERKMSVSLLRDTIAHSFELAQQAFLHEHPENEAHRPDPVLDPAPAKPKRVPTTAEKEFQTPWLDRRIRWAVDELARVRRVTPLQLVERAIKDFIDAHSDELGNAEAAQAKRLEELKTARLAAEVVERQKGAENQAYRERERAFERAKEASHPRVWLVSRCSAVSQQFAEFRSWSNKKPHPTIAEFEERLAALEAMMPAEQAAATAAG